MNNDLKIKILKLLIQHENVFVSQYHLVTELKEDFKDIEVVIKELIRDELVELYNYSAINIQRKSRITKSGKEYVLKSLNQTCTIQKV